ncbi:MAG: hypothetical protein JKY23_04440 [Nitrospinaceae bacterium]|nr:hypothetical protein [Nitrospinaceae bacterium]
MKRKKSAASSSSSKRASKNEQIKAVALTWKQLHPEFVLPKLTGDHASFVPDLQAFVLDLERHLKYFKTILRSK